MALHELGRTPQPQGAGSIPVPHAWHKPAQEKRLTDLTFDQLVLVGMHGFYRTRKAPITALAPLGGSRSCATHRL
jgi:hypothetical protein